MQVGRRNHTEKVRLGTRRGGRQGCRFGPDIFNAAYAAALQDVMNDIQKLGLFVCCSQLKKLDFWSAGDVEPPHLGSHRPNEQRAGKIVHVDDLGLMLAAATPGALMKKLPAALDSLGNIVRDTNCVSTFQPGKTKIMLHLSGKNQGKVKAKIIADGNKIHTPGGLHVRVVISYVHLGSTMGDDNADVEHRHNACMQSYVPIAHSVLGNCCFRVRDRVNLARSLCFSRLLFNVHVWSSLSPWAVRRLNGGYMRVLQRIAVQPKYKACQWTDEKVRVCLNMPEIMCYISQNRLCYLAQLAEGRADTLLSLLNMSCQLPWVILVKQDLVQLWTDRHRPLATRSTMQRFGRTTLHGSHQWKRQVRSWIRTSSVLAESATKGGCKRKTQNEYVFKCGTCGVCFEGDRALRCHEQVAHKKENTCKTLGSSQWYLL